MIRREPPSSSSDEDSDRPLARRRLDIVPQASLAPTSTDARLPSSISTARSRSSTRPKARPLAEVASASASTALEGPNARMEDAKMEDAFEPRLSAAQKGKGRGMVETDSTRSDDEEMAIFSVSDEDEDENEDDAMQVERDEGASFFQRNVSIARANLSSSPLPSLAL